MIKHNSNHISKALFWLSGIILVLGFISGLVWGHEASFLDDGYNWRMTLTVWFSAFTGAMVFAALAEIIRLLQTLVDRSPRVLSTSSAVSPTPAPILTSALTPKENRLPSEEPAYANDGETELQVYAKLSSTNILADSAYSEVYAKLIKQLNSLIFYFEVDDKGQVSQRLGTIRELYGGAKAGIMEYELENHEAWKRVERAYSIVEANYKKMI